ncbi:Sir2 family NAD-dependent protein deacetylase [Brachybacterium hainanense]|uniref:Sir2 family NAD-dependent protein deacetylase n=1 Tax=Brachybacterium hainanense TaxID=1541174 RepID=UPI00366EF434
MPGPDAGDGRSADLGRWFSTALPGTALGALGRRRAWGPLASSAYGRRSSPAELADGLSLLHGKPVAVLTGAGISTGSGLPDYRGPHAVPRSPMTYQEFTGSDLARRRYWARSSVGWTRFRAARPNPGHIALARLGPALPILGVITQNVDDLHRRAGSAPVVDLHGRLDRVRCLGCDALIGREGLHRRLLAMNPGFAARLDQLAREAETAPDGDAEVDRTHDFRYPPCALCGGVLKPDVVFFGESARPGTVHRATALVEAAQALLVLGSSLSVQSGLRLVRRAEAAGAAVVILGDGPTRGDDRATLRLHGLLDPVLTGWAEQLGR